MKRKPGLLCPSHGQEISDPSAAMQALTTKLKGWFHYWHPGDSQTTTEFEPTVVSQHLIAHPLATSTFYAIISDSGKALFIDYGSASWNFFQVFRDATDTYGRMRFVEHAIDKLKADHGLKTIDVAIPTHIHDDHTNGLPHLARRFGTRIFCYENMVEILENPRGRNLGCLLGEAIKIDRTLRHNETFHWEEFEFTVKHSPGHTDYQMALFATIDGKRIAFTGDAFFNYGHGPHLTHNLIYRNDTKVGDYTKSIRNLVDMKTEVVAPGHGEPFALTAEMIRAFEEDAKRQDEFLKDLIADPDTDVGLDPDWIQIYPYQAVATPGRPLRMEIRARNHRAAEVNLELALVLPPGWTSNPRRLQLKVVAQGASAAPIELTVPGDWRGPYERRAIAADVVADGRYLGQIAEAVVEVRTAAGNAVFPGRA
jgi:glyoxylase-like metal-dependent hydrolase (beta-lactamase superfamily II)